MIDPTRINLTTDPHKKRMTGVTYHGNISFDVPFVSQIEDNLWIGGCENGLVLPENFKHLISLYPWERYTVNHELDSALVVRMFDDHNVDMDKILSIADWANSCLNSGPTLIHCQAGLNRSSFVAAFMLMMGNRLITGKEVIDLIREKRSPACFCNDEFYRIVKDWDWIADS